MESLRDRCPVARALLHISFSLQCMNLPPDSRVSDVKGPLWRFPYPNHFLSYLPGSPVEEAPPEALSLSLYRVRCSIPRAPFILLPKSPVDKPSNRFPRGPLWGEMPVSRAFSTYPPGSPAREPFPQIPFTELPRRERHCTSRAPFNHLPKFPVEEPTPGCLSPHEGSCLSP